MDWTKHIQKKRNNEGALRPLSRNLHKLYCWGFFSALASVPGARGAADCWLARTVSSYCLFGANSLHTRLNIKTSHTRKEKSHTSIPECAADTPKRTGCCWHCYFMFVWLWPTRSLSAEKPVLEAMEFRLSQTPRTYAPCLWTKRRRWGDVRQSGRPKFAKVEHAKNVIDIRCDGHLHLCAK